MLKNVIKKIIVAVLVFAQVFGIMPVLQGNTSASANSFDYFENTGDENAYITFGTNVDSRNISYIEDICDGDAEIDEIEAKKFKNLYFNVDNTFYTQGTDTEFLISVVYYDYCNSSKDFTLTYHNLSGEKVEVTLEKQNREKGWTVSTVGIKNADFSKMFTTGDTSGKASLNLSCSATTPIRKVEIANFSKLKREKKSSTMTALGSTAATKNLLDFGLLTKDEADLFYGKNLSEQCSEYDLQVINNAFEGKDEAIEESLKESKLTQKELLSKFIKIEGITLPETNVVDYAISKGIVGVQEFFTADDAIANRYHLINLAKACFYLDPNPQDDKTELPIFKKILEKGLLNGIGINRIRKLGSEEMVEVYLYQDKKLMPKIQDGIDGVTYNFVNYYGEMLYRPYLTLNSWSTGGEAFACALLEENLGLNPYHLYMYNIKTNTIHYIDDIYSRDACEIVNGEYIYYLKKAKTSDGQVQSSIWKKHVSEDEEPELLMEIPVGAPVGMMHTTNDGRYISVFGKTEYFDIPEETTLLGTLDLQTGEYKYTYYSYNFSNVVSHVQINPEYPNLLFYVHEGDGEEFRLDLNYGNIEDRANIMNLDTNEAIKIEQGHVEDRDQNKVTFSHEQWSHDGEYLYATLTHGRGDFSPKRGVARVNKDGTHRKYYDFMDGIPKFLWDQKLYLYANHSSPSGDGRYFSVDSGEVSILSAETNQIFPICDLIVDGEHPYHAHATIASDTYVVSWGDVDHTNKVLGVAWYDFSHLDDYLAEGGRFSLNEDIEYVRYHETRDGYPEILADINEESIGGKNALFAPEGKRIYLDINDNIVDGVNETVEIEFDYYDDSSSPITITYTNAYETQNDISERENKFIEVTRTSTNAWKTATVVLDKGNFETIGKFDTDFYIAGEGGVYIGDVRIKDASSKTNRTDVIFSKIEENEENYVFTGKISKKQANIQGVDLIGAQFGASKQFEKSSTKEIDISTDSFGNFTMLLPKTLDGEVKFYVWDKSSSLKPTREETVVKDLGLTAQSKANGVLLSWDSVDGVDFYEIYKDGKKIAETSETTYGDKYFSTVEQFHNDFKMEYTTDHDYLIVAGKYVSKSVKCCADTSLIKYISFYNNTDGTYGIETGRANPYVTNATALNKESHGIRMSSRLPDSNMGDLNPYNNIVNPQDYSRYFYNEDLSSTYKTRFVGGIDDENSFFADRNGLRLVTATCTDRTTLINYIRKNTNSGKESSTAIKDETLNKGYKKVTTKPFGVVESFGDTEAEEYVVLLTARVPTSASINLFEVTTKVPVNTRNTSTDSSWEDVSEAVPYANGTDEIIRVYHGTTGRETGRSYKPAEDNKFYDPTPRFDTSVFNNLFYTYEFNIKAYFGDKLVNTGAQGYWENDEACDSNIRFVAEENSVNGDTATIKSIAFIKARDYIK